MPPPNFDLLQFYRRLRKIKDLRELKAVLDEVECAVKPGLAGTLRFKNQKGEQFRIEVNEDSEDAAFANWSRTLAGVTLHVDYKYVIGMARDGRFFGFWDRQGGEGEGRFAFLRECPSAPPLAEITSALGIR
jgi:hypothetical protein